MNSDPNPSEVRLLPIATLVLWTGCAIVGALGMLLPYPWPQAPRATPPPVLAQIVHVELTNDTSAPPEIGPPAADTSVLQPPSAVPAAPAAPPAPAMVSVATPSPSIAFPLEVQGPSHTVDAAQAVPAPQPATQSLSVQTPSVPQHLTYGQGEGRQPAPDYPREAALAHQQGTVVVRFTVGEDGRVQTAQAITPSPYPLLNQAAVRAVRETWRFRAGPVRSFEVSIEFQLRKNP